MDLNLSQLGVVPLPLLQVLRIGWEGQITRQGLESTAEGEGLMFHWGSAAMRPETVSREAS